MTYNDLLHGGAYTVAKVNLMKDYSNAKPEDLDHLLMEVWFEDGEHTCAYWGKSFSYCLFTKYKSQMLIEQEAMLKANNPVFYEFAKSVKHILGH